MGAQACKALAGHTVAAGSACVRPQWMGRLAHAALRRSVLGYNRYRPDEPVYHEVYHKGMTQLRTSDLASGDHGAAVPQDVPLAAYDLSRPCDVTGCSRS